MGSTFFTAPIGERLFDFALVNRIAQSGIVMVAAGLLVAAWSLGAARAVVLEQLPVWAAIVRGAQLVWGKFTHYAAITLMFTALGIAVSVAYAAALAPILFVSVLPNISQPVSGLEGYTFTDENFGLLAIVAAALALAVGTWVSAFTSAVWTLAYQRWRTTDPVEDLELEPLREQLRN